MNSNFFSVRPLRKTLVYHMGKEAGFFSEFNNMVLGILYCYKNDINFKLYSKDANFGYINGWTDFFQPFCEEVLDSFHSVYNVRQPIGVPSGRLYKIKGYIYKLLYHFNYYTYELWQKFHNRDFELEKFVIDNKEMDILDASKYIIDEIWKYNDVTQKEVSELVQKASVPSLYVGLHIRRGDKVIEHDNEEINKYMAKLHHYSNIRDVFVYTDNYDVIDSLRNSYLDYNFYTLVEQSEHGYFHQEFLKKDPQFKKKAILKMFASIDILSEAEYCVGTFSTNPGMFLGMRMQKGRMVGVDYDSWRIW